MVCFIFYNDAILLLVAFFINEKEGSLKREKNNLTIIFNNNVTKIVSLRLYDDMGKLLIENNIPSTYNNLSYNLKFPELAQGIYFLQTSIGDSKPQIVKLFCGNR